jgi:hydrogenase maturation protein HypF
MKTPPPARLKVSIRGAVQGVGFRPFVYRLATEHNLAGWVRNSAQGVFIEAEGPRGELEHFLRRLESDKPPRSSIQNLESSWLPAAGGAGFEIRASETSGDKTAVVLPDIATCADCRREIFDPANRRYLYPFTNCTHCGPRFSIIEALPYDRGNTSMKGFAMCPQCQREYDKPADRRFHAQPNACPHCGPRLELHERSSALFVASRPLARGHNALLAAADALRQGKIIAVKGIGGFHLMADARDDRAVSLLRRRKHREEKPFALLFPSLKSAGAVCHISSLEEQLLVSPQAPIVLLERRESGTGCIAESVAPGNPNLGVMLPSNPLHHLLMAELDFPVVATSGNVSDEPICTDESDAFQNLRHIADLFLTHNRPIVRHVDDSIARVVLGREMLLRRARGYAPLPIPAAGKPADAAPGATVLAVGGHLKNTVALAVGPQVFISQHIGDLETEKANTAFCRTITDFQKLYGVKPEIVAADLHPDYLSTLFASRINARPFGVQHHVAHVLACMADNEIEPPVLGVSWDGTGYGTDNTIWGGEFFLVRNQEVRRVAHLRPFPLPGADAAIREPRRAAIGLLYELVGEMAFDLGHVPTLQQLNTEEQHAFERILQGRFRSPLTSSMGRLFDAVASLTGLRQFTRFEGQAAMELEFVASRAQTDDTYPIAVRGERPFQLDWQAMVQAILSDVWAGVPVGLISAKFHNALAAGIVEIARRIGLPRVVLSGGCFQNRRLLENAVTRLRAENFEPFWHRSVPPNDGGIALGQIVAARKNISLASQNPAPPVCA